MENSFRTYTEMVNLRLGERRRDYSRFRNTWIVILNFFLILPTTKEVSGKKTEKEQLNKTFKILNFLKKIKSLIDKVTRRTIPIS